MQRLNHWTTREVPNFFFFCFRNLNVYKGKLFEKKKNNYVHIYIYIHTHITLLNYFVVCLKITQHCKSTIFQLKKVNCYLPIRTNRFVLSLSSSQFTGVSSRSYSSWTPWTITCCGLSLIDTSPCSEENSQSATV